MRSVGPVDPAAPTVGRFTLTGRTEITLRNGTTGRRATLGSSGAHAVDTRTGAVIFYGPQVWFWTTGKHVPFLATTGSGAFSPDARAPAPGRRPRACSTRARSSAGAAAEAARDAAPWPLPTHALTAIGRAGLTPLLGRVIRHDHVHLDVIVNGRAVKVPGGIGLAEPLDGGPCPQGPKSSGDCATGETIFAQVANSPLHTHASSGLVHIESDRDVPFTLGQVFDEWGVRFDRRCLGALLHPRRQGAARLRQRPARHRRPAQRRAARAPGARGRLRQRLRLGAVALHRPLARAGLRRPRRGVLPAA